MPELWQPVVGNEHYLVSNLGRVKSLRRNLIMKQCWLDGRYLALKIKGKMRKVHHLVAEAFIGPRPDGLWCLHKDDDKSNNASENLYWGTPRQNSQDVILNGNRQDQNGEKNPMAKLTADDVREIRRLIGLGVVQRRIAEQFCVSPMLVTDIKRHKVWAHLG